MNFKFEMVLLKYNIFYCFLIYKLILNQFQNTHYKNPNFTSKSPSRHWRVDPPDSALNPHCNCRPSSDRGTRSPSRICSPEMRLAGLSRAKSLLQAIKFCFWFCAIKGKIHMFGEPQFKWNLEGVGGNYIF